MSQIRDSLKCMELLREFNKESSLLKQSRDSGMNKFTLNLPTQPPTQEELDFLQSVIEAEESEEEFINRIKDDKK
jgi:hypothetical protein